MDLRLLGLLAVVQCLSAVENDCPRLDIPNGYFISEQNNFSPDNQLYYACDIGFKPVTIGWWATIICQNGKWSSAPLCIEETSCFDPQIPNANYTKVSFVKHDTKLKQIRCNSGYEDKNRRATADCTNGKWTLLPVCEKIDYWCGLPPQIPNAVIINQVYKDMFQESAEVEYVCQTGFKREGPDKARCINGEWKYLPSCTAPVDTGSDNNHQPMFTTIDKCGKRPPPVNNGVSYVDRMFVTYQCNYLYKLIGNRIVRCASGQWTQIPTCEVDYCKLDTSSYNNLENEGNVFIKSGTEVKLSCTRKWYGARTAYAVCIDNQLSLSECCVWISHETGSCGKIL